MLIVLFANTDWYLYNFRLSTARAIRQAGHKVLLVSPPGEYSCRFESLGFRWMPVSMRRRSLNPFSESWAFIELARLFARERPEIVHSFTLKCAVYGSLAARVVGVSRRVNAVAGLGYIFSNSSWRARLLRPLVRQMLRLSMGGPGAQLIVQNPDDRDEFAGPGMVDRNKIVLIPGSGVDMQRFRVNPSNQRRNSRLRILFASRFLWEKGIGEFVEASRLLQAEGLNIEFLLAGKPDDGNPASVPRSQVHAWVSEGLVRWLGHVNDMPALFADVDAFVLPTYYREGLPKSLIEAAACGLPLVTTNVPGCREVVSHEVDGLVVPARNAVALAAAIRRLHDSPALANRLGQAARAKALLEFDERLVVDRTLATYGLSASAQNSLSVTEEALDAPSSPP